MGKYEAHIWDSGVTGQQEMTGHARKEGVRRLALLPQDGWYRTKLKKVNKYHLNAKEMHKQSCNQPYWFPEETGRDTRGYQRRLIWWNKWVWGQMIHFCLGFLVLLILAEALLSSDSELCGTEYNKCDQLNDGMSHASLLLKRVTLFPGEGAGIWWCAIFPLPLHTFIFSENKWYKSRRWGRTRRKRKEDEGRGKK